MSESSNDGVLQRMTQLIESWEGRHDRRCIFLRCYADMTAATLGAIQDRRFHDNPWTGRLLGVFVGYYFRALNAYEQGIAAVPAPWKWAHDLTQLPTTLPVEALVLGINAHINHDLALAVSDLLCSEWADLDEAERSKRHDDFLRINDIIAETTRLVQHDVLERYDHFLRGADPIVSPAIHGAEWECGRLIKCWRDEAWSHGIQLVEATSAEERERLRHAIEQGAVHRVRVVISTIELRHELLARPIEELARLHPHPPVAARFRSAQVTAQS
ncbi:MAG TPA: DUF5995 family protein [Chloroflexota bacterium]|nr:DUF5995 family protein [Chloroflexota bacterium]